jgi:hypothetical protein
VNEQDPPRGAELRRGDATAKARARAERGERVAQIAGEAPRLGEIVHRLRRLPESGMAQL